jgi:hypothetical protein
MTEGMIGAAPEELLALAKTMESSGAALKTLSSTLHNAISQARWSGPDSERFRSQWNNGMRMKLRSTGESLAGYSSLLVAQAAEQEQASADTGGAGSGGAGGSTLGSPSNGGGAENGGPLLDGIVDANGNPVYQAGNLATTIAGTFADSLLAKMIKGNLLEELPWSVLGSKAGQLGQYFKGTQLLNGLYMAGRAAGVLSVIGGGAQLVDGLVNGKPYQALDGGITTVLAVGSFIPVVGPAFAVAGIAWAGLGMLSSSLGYGSTSEMVGAGVQWAGEKFNDGAQWLGKESANLAKKAWGWLGGG